MKALFDKVSSRCSKITTQAYSTSFSLGIKMLSGKMHNPIYAIYGFVRLADEIVDSFHDYEKAQLLRTFREQTFEAIEQRISLNPILNSFQHVVHQYHIEHVLIETFLDSMEMDLHQQCFSRSLYERYILGSAEVVGLMCLHVFVDGSDDLYEKLKHPAMKLGAAFQKVNFLRDIRSDRQELGRIYFPNINIENFSFETKIAIEKEIEHDFDLALEGIKQLPLSSRRGVYLAYTYYKVLFNKIKNLSPHKVMTNRIRVANTHKIGLMLQSMVTRGLY